MRKEEKERDGREGGGGYPTIPPGWVGCIYRVLLMMAPPAPGIHQHAACTPLARCHRHGGIGVHHAGPCGSVWRNPWVERLLVAQVLKGVMVDRQLRAESLRLLG